MTHQVGMYSTHPAIPEDLSERARKMILRCFEPDPEKRSNALQLLEDPFIQGWVF